LGDKLNNLLQIFKARQKQGMHFPLTAKPKKKNYTFCITW